MQSHVETMRVSRERWMVYDRAIMRPLLISLTVSLMAACVTGRSPKLEAGVSTLAAGDATKLSLHRWPTPAASTKAVILIVHGASEHSARYDRFARFLNENGYAVYAMDLRGHGATRLRSG